LNTRFLLSLQKTCHEDDNINAAVCTFLTHYSPIPTFHYSNWGEAPNLMTIQQEQLDRAIEIPETFGATRLILFGSAAHDLEQAKDIDLACDGVAGWKIFELGARLEEELKIALDLIPLSPPNRFTRIIERRGRLLL
jgi:predicted nucleotidyltransferase